MLNNVNILSPSGLSADLWLAFEAKIIYFQVANRDR